MTKVQFHAIHECGEYREHGGQVRRAAQRYGIPVERWLDLSTGISPHSWPVVAIPAEVWQRLPEEEDGLEDATRAYFGTANVLAVAGSQAAIQALPRLRNPGRVGVLSPTYAEHAKAWRAAGHTVVCLAVDDVGPALPSLDTLVVVNPNNPTGESLDPARLRAWHAELAPRGGWLVVDEAFADAHPHASVAAHVAAHVDRHLVVLRSLGKFWGLAGVRVGFVLAAPELLNSLAAWLGPWQVGHPGRWIARHALADHAWIETARVRLQRDSERLAVLLRGHGLPTPGGCALFRWVPTREPAHVHDAFAQRGILIRAFPEHGGVRLGLPGSEQHWRALQAALQALAEDGVRSLPHSPEQRTP